MKLVLDSNIFCQDYRLASANFRLLREGLHIIPADLKVPEVVLDEVANRFREILEEALAAAKKAEKALNRLLRRPVQSALTSISVIQEAQAYREWLLSKLKELGAEILPYPEVPHKEVVERDLQRKRPFKRDGSGYRDFLIWESIRRLMLWGTERIIFVTANTKDFGDGPRVAPELQKDILNPDRLELVPCLKNFNDKFVVPRLRMVDDLKARLQSKAGTSFNITHWLRDSLVDLLRNEELGPIVAGFPDGVGSVYPTEIVAFEAIAIDDVRELSEHERLVRITVQVDIEFSVDIDWDDYTWCSEVREWAGECSEPFIWSSSKHVDRLKLGITLVLDSTGEKLVDAEIGLIEGSYGSVELTSW
ncbi:MAG: PIN domain-containing protein [Bacillota bacterium]